MPERRQEMDSAEKKFSSLLDRRNELNAASKQLQDERRGLFDQKEFLFKEMDQLKNARNDANSKIQAHKKARNQYQKLARAKIQAKKKKVGDVHSNLVETIEVTKADIRMMEITQETRGMPLDAENELLDKIRLGRVEIKRLDGMLRAQVDITKDIENLDASITELFGKSDEEHRKLVELSEEWGKHQDRIKVISGEMTHLLGEARKKSEKINKIRASADEFHNKAMEMREKVFAIRKERRDEAKAARAVVSEHNKAARSALQDEKEIKKKEDDIVALLMKGGKIELGGY